MTIVQNSEKSMTELDHRTPKNKSIALEFLKKSNPNGTRFTQFRAQTAEW